MNFLFKETLLTSALSIILKMEFFSVGTGSE